MRRIFILAILSVLSLHIVAQKKYEQRAEKYFKYYNYERALKDYLRLYRKAPNDEKLLEKIIDCYLKDNTPREQALPYLEKLLELKPENAKANFNYALALYHNHQFDEAKNQLIKNQHLINSDDELREKSIALQATINNAYAFVQSSVNVEFINLGENINTSRNEISPFVTYDENVLFYSSDKRYNSYAGIYYFNICVSEMNKHQHEKGKTIGSKINSVFDEMVAGIDPYRSQLMVFHNKNKEEQMAYAEYLGNYMFEALKEYGTPLDGQGAEFGVWFTASGDSILFSGDSENGDTDLYYSIKLPDGSWGVARELSGKINTKYNENFPVLSEDGQRLYFSSDNDKSMGGYDLFYSDYDKATQTWSEAVNMGYPINDTYDNYNISWVYGKRHAYVSSIRPEGYGARDIYKVIFNEKEAFNAIIKCDIRLQTDTGLVIPEFAPRITVRDTMEFIVGRYRATQDSSQFIMALTPGEYIIQIDEDDLPQFSQRLSIPEKWYDSIANRMQLIIKPKEEE